MSMLASLCRGAGGRGRGLERYGATAAPAATAAEMAWRRKDGEAAKMALDAVAEPEAVRVAAARTFGRGSGWGRSGQVLANSTLLVVLEKQLRFPEAAG